MHHPVTVVVEFGGVNTLLLLSRESRRRQDKDRIYSDMSAEGRHCRPKKNVLRLQSAATSKSAGSAETEIADGTNDKIVKAPAAQIRSPLGQGGTNMTLKTAKHILLIATVGGAPELLSASIMRWKPKKVVFVSSDDALYEIDEIAPKLAENGYELDVGRYEPLLLSDPQSLGQCVLDMRKGLERRTHQWCERGEEFGCVVDFTGGTKCMSAALVLVARPWTNSRLSYVEGDQRDRNDVGTGASGQEQVVHEENPWDSLGYQVIEDSKEAFDRHSFREGAQQLRDALKRVSVVDSRKSELNALATFMEAYDLWRNSEYKKALDKFRICKKNLNDLAEALHPIRPAELRTYISYAQDHLTQLKDSAGNPTKELIVDLIADAMRRQGEGRHVDAVARLYRAVEAIAQLRLWEEFEIRTSSVPIEHLPQPMRERMQARAENGKLKIALQEAFEMLKHLGDPKGAQFAELGWNEKGSPLQIRNESIAGHGFTPVSAETTDKLLEGVLLLADYSHEDIFEFPKLGPYGNSNG